jgi:galactokinase
MVSEPARRAAAAFAERFGRPPQVLARAPGRVNLVGEHTDYSLLPVLPLAIQRATWVALGASDDGLVLAESLQFEGPARLSRADPLAGVSAPWQRYLAGVLLELAGAAPGRGARILVHGDLPAGGGLSSSSSLTMGLLAALDGAWGLGLGSDGLVLRGIVAERHVGVESGGMDQTVIARARAGAALRIDFEPAGQRAVPLPAELALVAAHSGRAAPKGGAVQRAYNQRVLGCRLAAALLACELGLSAGTPPVLGRVAGHPGTAGLLPGLPGEASPAQVAAQTGVAASRLVRLTAGRLEPDAPVPVRAVARHVLGEARRVDRAERALLEGDLEALGVLLDRSHASLAGDFRCSTGALDRLCAAMRGAGALGARLTGAGFGGHALAACTPETLPAVLRAARQASGGAAFEVRASQGLQLI